MLAIHESRTYLMIVDHSGTPCIRNNFTGTLFVHLRNFVVDIRDKHLRIYSIRRNKWVKAFSSFMLNSVLKVKNIDYYRDEIIFLVKENLSYNGSRLFVFRVDDRVFEGSRDNQGLENKDENSERFYEIRDNLSDILDVKVD